jgi:hypothetical protein
MIRCDCGGNSDNVPLNDRMINELEAMTLLRYSAGIWLKWLMVAFDWSDWRKPQTILA